MANFIVGDREQGWLMPPSVAEWLPAGHLAWFVLEVVDELDLSAFELAYRTDGRGGAAYHPRLMVGLVVYAYATGERSSRRIERRCVEDVAYRVLAANLQPDHATIARFRAAHEAALGGLFAQVLGLCVRAGLVQASVVAVDGTRMHADASKDANRTLEQLASEVLREAAAVDEAEDAEFGEARGDELADGWDRREGRRGRIRQALADLRAEAEAASVEAKLAKRAAREQATGKKVSGRKPSGGGRAQQSRKQANTTDPESRLMSTAEGRFIQGYNAQTAATADQVVVAAQVTNATNDVDQFVPMVAASETNLAAAGADEKIGTVVADAGYFSNANASAPVEPDVVIATGKARRIHTNDLVDLDQRRQGWEPLLRRIENGEISQRQAAREAGVSPPEINERMRRWRAGDLLSPRERMDHKLADPTIAAVYAKRATAIEPIFGQIKHDRGIRRFMRRGLAACDSEWKLITATHNLRKLWKAQLSPGRA